jgi:predicted short-subunit dehydrogenase-like oxidoreductase (DUF2520 family)
MVSLVGCGRAGGAIGLALSRSGYEIAAAWSRTRGGRQRAHRLLNVPILSHAAEVAGLGDVVIVAVPDNAIADVGAEIASGIRSGALAIHTSGGVSVDALSAVRDAGGRTGSAHPLQTFPDAARGAEALRGAAVAVTCDTSDVPVIYRLARAWGGRPFMLADKAKTVYHAAAVYASNYLVTSVWAALELLQDVGVGNARLALTPLVQASIANVLSMPPDKAITGPVARGDADTVRRHLDALRSTDPTQGRIADAYASLARLTAALTGQDADSFEKATA